MTSQPARARRLSFAEQEQSLFRHRLAAPEVDIGFGATRSNDMLPATTDKGTLLQALTGWGARPAFGRWDAGGDGDAARQRLDQATVAARAARSGTVAGSHRCYGDRTGRSSRANSRPGEVVELAARSLHSRSQPAAAPGSTSGVRDRSALGRSSWRDASRRHPQSGGALLLHEERGNGRPPARQRSRRPCVGQRSRAWRSRVTALRVHRGIRKPGRAGELPRPASAESRLRHAASS